MNQQEYDSIPKEMKERNNWVCVRNGSKIPFRVTGSPASSTQRETWSDCESAWNGVLSGRCDGIGFCFDGDGIVGIDIDDGFDADRFLTEKAARIIDCLHSYTEVSRSGRGFHIYVKGEIPFSGRNNGKSTEIYQRGRYFIVTGKTMFYDQLVENQTGIDWVVNTYFPEMVNVAHKYNRTRAKRICETSVDCDFNRISIRPDYPQIRKGERNISMLSLGCSLLRAGLCGEDMAEELHRVNRERCNPPLEQGELRCIIRQVLKYR